MEEWEEVPGYNGQYLVSNKGRVKRKTQHGFRIRKPSENGDGYLYVILHKDSKRKYCRIHRLVAIAFIPNPKGLPQVNHINADKKDNRVENLEWCSCEMNVKHAIEHGLRPINITRNHTVLVRNNTTGQELRFASKRSAGRYFNTTGISINDWINGVTPKRDDLKNLSFFSIPV